MPKNNELTKQDIFNLRVSMGYQPDTVTVSRDTVEELIEAWEELQKRKLAEERDDQR